jgi:hypothetical protein
MYPSNCFYVYFYLRPDGTPYYVGKGKGGRAFQKHEGIKIPKDKERIIFVGVNMSEQDAFALEMDQIAFYGRKDLGTGILRNRTDGGEGCTGHKHREETKQRLREASSGERNPMYGRKGLESPVYGKPKSEATKKKLRDSLIGKPKTEEHKRKLSGSRKGKKPAWFTSEGTVPLEIVKKRVETRKKNGKKMSEEQKSKLRKPVYLIHPDGHEEWFPSVMDAAFKHNLNKGHIASICRGERKSHKGFKARFDLLYK